MHLIFVISYSFAFIREQVRRWAPSKRSVFSHEPEKFFGDENMIEKRYFISHQLKQEVYSSLELFFLYAQLSRESSESCAWICRYAQDKQSRCCLDLCWGILHHRSQPTASFPAANLSIPSSPRKHRALSLAVQLNSWSWRSQLCWQGPSLWLSVCLCNRLRKSSSGPPAYCHQSVPTSTDTDIRSAAATTEPCTSLGLHSVYWLILHT